MEQQGTSCPCTAEKISEGGTTSRPLYHHPPGPPHTPTPIDHCNTCSPKQWICLHHSLHIGHSVRPLTTRTSEFTTRAIPSTWRWEASSGVPRRQPRPSLPRRRSPRTSSWLGGTHPIGCSHRTPFLRTIGEAGHAAQHQQQHRHRPQPHFTGTRAIRGKGRRDRGEGVGGTRRHHNNKEGARDR